MCDGCCRLRYPPVRGTPTPAPPRHHHPQSYAAIARAVSDRRTEILPRQTFKFSNQTRLFSLKQALEEGLPIDGMVQPVQPAADAGVDAGLLADAVIIKDVQDSTFIIDEAVVDDNSGDVRVQDCSGATLVITAVPRALRIDRLTDCTVVAGGVAGSVLLHDCTGCKVMFVSRQARLHRSHGCDFYIWTSSGPVIEHCDGMRFAPYPVAWPTRAEDLLAAGLDELHLSASGMWAHVADFNWHRAQASPNWSLLPVDARMSAGPVLPGCDYVIEFEDSLASARTDAQCSEQQQQQQEEASAGADAAAAAAEPSQAADGAGAAQPSATAAADDSSSDDEL